MADEGVPLGQDSDAGERSPARLIVLSGHGKGNSYLVPADGRLTLGRAESNDVIVPDSEASRRHCVLVVEKGRVRIEDLGTTNGTFVGEERVTECALEPGAKLRIGRTVFVVVMPDAAGGAAPAKESEPQDVVEGVAAAEPAAPQAQAEPGAKPKRRRRRAVLAAAALVAAAAVVAAIVHSGVGRGWVSSATRTIAVQTTPEAVELFVDNRFVGLTPAEVQVSSDRPHALRLARAGCQTWRTAIDASTPRSLTVVLEPEPAATLIVRASKPDTEVYMDGRLVGQAGPDQEVRVPDVRLGEHELRLQRPNYLTWTQRVDVSRAGEMRIYGKLESREEASILNLIAKDPNSALLYTELGHQCMVNKNFDRAMEAYKKAMALVYGGTDTSGYNARLRAELQKVVQGGEGLFKFGTVEETRVACQKLEDVFVALSGDYPAAKTNLTWLLEHYNGRNMQEDAARLQKKLLNMDPDNVELYFQLSATSLARNDYEAAIQVLQEAMKKFPQNWSVYYRLGLAHSRRAASDSSEKDRQLAIENLTKAQDMCTSPAYKRNIEYYITKAKELKVQ